MPPMLRPMAPTAAAAILCGDPARALAIAQHVIDEPRMSNHHRGLWGYWGRTPSGAELTVHATGIGGPSAALVLSELGRRGVAVAVRVGTAGAAAGARTDGKRALAIGETVAVEAAISGDGASVAWGAESGELLTPDPELTSSLAAEADRAVTVLSLDRPPQSHGAAGSRAADIPSAGSARAEAYDMQTAALLAAGRALGLRVGAAAVISRSRGVPLEDDPLERAALRLADLAVAALRRT